MYSFKSRIRYSEIDVNKQLSMTGIINYFQDCSTFQSEDLGLGLDYLSKKNRAWWLSSWQIVIERRPVFGEAVIISTWPYDFKAMYGYRNFTIQDQDGNYLVKANSVWFFFDIQAGRPVKIQEEDVRGYGTGEEKRLDMVYADRRIRVPEAYQAGEPIIVTNHYIDTNHHVNNAQYVEMARECLPGDIDIRELRVEYKKAAVLGDVLYPRISCEGNASAIALCDDTGSPYAVVWLEQDKQRPDSTGRKESGL
ncbi:MAG: acyl-[acyl-carrier-protein] thioesterase [Lachnospiraceae bacterium]